MKKISNKETNKMRRRKMRIRNKRSYKKTDKMMTNKMTRMMRIKNLRNPLPHQKDSITTGNNQARITSQHIKTTMLSNQICHISKTLRRKENSTSSNDKYIFFTPTFFPFIFQISKPT